MYNPSNEFKVFFINLLIEMFFNIRVGAYRMHHGEKRKGAALLAKATLQALRGSLHPLCLKDTAWHLRANKDDRKARRRAHLEWIEEAKVHATKRWEAWARVNHAFTLDEVVEAENNATLKMMEDRLSILISLADEKDEQLRQMEQTVGELQEALRLERALHKPLPYTEEEAQGLSHNPALSLPQVTVDFEVLAENKSEAVMKVAEEHGLRVEEVAVDRLELVKPEEDAGYVTFGDALRSQGYDPLFESSKAQPTSPPMTGDDLRSDEEIAFVPGVRDEGYELSSEELLNIIENRCASHEVLVMYGEKRLPPSLMEALDAHMPECDPCSNKATAARIRYGTDMRMQDKVNEAALENEKKRLADLGVVSPK